MKNKLRDFADKIYFIAENSDSYLDGLEELEEVLKTMPVFIKDGIENTQVSITKEDCIVIEPVLQKQNIELTQHQTERLEDSIDSAITDFVIDERLSIGEKEYDSFLNAIVHNVLFCVEEKLKE